MVSSVQRVRLTLALILLVVLSGVGAEQTALAQARGDSATIKRDQLAVANAKADVTRAKTDYATKLNTKRQDFNRSSMLQSAQKAVTEAYNKVNAARDRILKQLAKDENYIAAKKKEQDAQAKVESLREKKVTGTAMSDASTAVLVAARPVAEMEKKALDGDDAYKEASEELATVTKALAKLKEDFETGLPKDAEIVKLKKAQADAELKLEKAENKLRSEQ